MYRDCRFNPAHVLQCCTETHNKCTGAKIIQKAGQGGGSELMEMWRHASAPAVVSSTPQPQLLTSSAADDSDGNDNSGNSTALNEPAALKSPLPCPADSGASCHRNPKLDKKRYYSVHHHTPVHGATGLIPDTQLPDSPGGRLDARPAPFLHVEAHAPADTTHCSPGGSSASRHTACCTSIRI